MKKLNVLAGIGCAVLMSYGTTVYAKSDNKPADTGGGNTTTTTTPTNNTGNGGGNNNNTTTTTTTAVVPLNWTAGTATIDGSISEWNLSADASNVMCEAGWINSDGSCRDKDHLSTLYARYDCNTNTMYVLVLKEDGHTADGQRWVKIYDLANSEHPISIADVSIGGVSQGYEASFSLAAGTYNDVEIHINIDGGRTSSTGKNGSTRSIIVPENCTVPVVEEPKTCADAEYAAANPTECPVEEPKTCADAEYAAANPTECPVEEPKTCADAEYAAANPEACEVTYGDSKASVVGIWKYVGSMSVQDFDATYKEGTDYVFTGDDSGDYLLQGIDDEGKTTSMSGAKMK